MSNGLKIKGVININQQGTKRFTVGIDGIAEIKDNSIEYKNSIHVQFDAYDKNKKLIGTFINGALAIDYF
jgi:hypothetical protein